MALKVGDKAPDFKLTSFTPSEEPVEIDLNSYKGIKNVVLLFFPQAFTGVCTKEMCTFSDGLELYKGLNAEVLGISVDGTFVQKAFAKANNITVPLLSDFNKDVVRRYDVLLPEFAHGMRGVAKRSAFVIDKNGIIKYAEITPTPGDMVNIDAIKKAVSAL
ncbi:MAG: redoxin domain-containing protein [Ignavibacteria bacterium]|jgi:peroxiredoxin